MSPRRLLRAVTTTGYAADRVKRLGHGGSLGPTTRSAGSRELLAAEDTRRREARNGEQPESWAARARIRLIWAVRKGRCHALAARSKQVYMRRTRRR